MSDTAEKLEEQARRAKLVVWLWGVFQVGAGVVLGLLADRIVPDPAAAAVAKPLMIFFGVALGVSYVVLEYHLEAIVKRDLRAMKQELGSTASDERQKHSQETARIVRAELSDLRSLLPIFNSYLSISDQDTFGHRDRILGLAQQQLLDLAGGRMELEGNEYYDWLKDRLTNRRPSTVYAVSFRPLSVYSDEPREKNFMSHNRDAISKGTKITRIFILDEADLVTTQSRRVLKHHFTDTGAVCFVAWKRQIDADVMKKLGGGGLSIYDGEDVFYDRSYFEQSLASQGTAASDKGQSSAVRPRAIVFSKKHPEFNSYRKLFDTLLVNMVDPQQKDCAGLECYVWNCRHVLAWAETAGHSPEGLQELKEELAQLASSQSHGSA